jgi:hypothetical protein
MIFAGDGYVYTQVPFKSNDEGMYGLCAPTGAKNMKDSVAKIKCFYILLENYKKGERYEYLVTMIPAKQMETQGRDYDFLSKPNFTGLVIYSSLKGEYIREEIYKNGIVYNGKLWSVEEYRSVGKTKDAVVNGGTLKSITVVAHIPKRRSKPDNNIIDIPDIIGDPDVNNNDNTGPVKLESSIDPNSNGTNGKGGSAQTPTPNSKYYVAYSYSSCSEIESGGDSVSRGTTWISHHPADDKGEDCKFMYWNGGIQNKCSRIAFIPEVNRDYDVQAVYIDRKDDPNCFIISYLFGNGDTRYMLDTLLINTLRDDTEDGYMLGGIMDGPPIRGYRNIKFHYYPDQRFTGMYHTHPNDDVIPSEADFYTLYNMIANFSVDKYSFSYVIAGYHELLYLHLTDWSKFLSEFGKVSTSGNEFDIIQHWKDFLENSGIKKDNATDGSYNKMVEKLSEFGIGYQMVPLNPSYLSPLPETGYYFMNYDNSGSYDGTYWDTTIKDCLIKYGLTK